MSTLLPPPSAGPPGSVAALPPPRPADRDPAGQWKPWTAFGALAAALAASLFVAVIVGVVGSAFGAPLDDPSAAVNLVGTFGGDACFVGAALWFASRVASPRPAQFGLRPAPVGRAVALVTGGYVLFLIITALWTKALDLHEVDKLPKTLGANESTIALVAVCVLTCVVAPICEEFLFRGYMFRALRNWRGVWPAALIVGLIFGGVHVSSAPVGFLLPLALFGVILCFVYQLSGSLYPGISLHAVNNSLALASVESWRLTSGLALAVAALGTIFVLMTMIVVPRWAGMGRAGPAL